MRALAAGNKKRFALFAIIIIIIIGILITCLRFVLKNGAEEFEVSSNVFLYDKEYVPIETEQAGTIKQKWDGNYYLTLNDKSQTYALSNKVVAYDMSNGKVDLFGEVFKVLLDGQVEKTSGRTEVKDLNQNQFYKLDDRQYLVVGNSIRNDTGSIVTSKYLYVVIDKAGNTLLLNNQINAKTINPMIIETSSFRFDIAKEKLIIGSDEIDLKKIIGSTNEYKEKEKQEENKTEENDNNDNQDNDQNNGNNNNGQGQNNYPNNGQNSGANGNSNGNSSSGSNDNNMNISVGTGSNNKTPLAKSVSLRSAVATSSYIDIEYIVNDPENKYQTVYAFIESEGFEKTIALDKAARTYRVTDLEPNTEYTITLGYKEILQDNTVQDYIEDMLSVRTAKVDAVLTITKVKGSKVYFNFKMDPNYSFDAGKIKLYVDGEEQGLGVDINVNKAVTATGWNSSLEYTYGSEITLRLEEATHNGVQINNVIEAKFRNY